MKKVSIIVPTKNSERTIEKCLVSVRNQDYKNIEIIVVDNKSNDGTYNISSKYCDYVFIQGPERSAQRNYGVSKSTGDYVLIIDSDMILSENVVSECVKTIELENRKVLVIPEESFGENFWAKCKKLERSFYVGVDWMEAGRFFDKKIFLEFSGYDEKNTGTEDYDLPQRIEYKYGRSSIGRINSFIFHDEGKISLLYSCKKKFYYAGRLNKYRSEKSNENNFKKQSSVLQRYFLYFKKPHSLFKNPIVGFGMLFMKTCELFSGALGFIFKKDLDVYK